MAGRRAEALHDQIEDLILTGAFPPGARLDEVSLATRFGVSRTPIREALMTLAANGIVVLRPRRGAVVAEVGPGRLVEMFEVMAELEGMCARLAARRATAADIEAIRACHRRCAAAAEDDDEDVYYYENEAFHEAIDAACHQGFLGEQTRALRRRLRPYRRLQLRARGRVRGSFDEHEAIFRAIEAGDPEAAETAMRAHVAVQGERFSDLVSSLAGGPAAARA